MAPTSPSRVVRVLVLALAGLCSPLVSTMPAPNAMAYPDRAGSQTAAAIGPSTGALHVRGRAGHRMTAEDTAGCPGTPWSCTDIGAPSAAGSDALSGGTWQATGAGAGIPTYADATWDQFHFDYQSLTGSGSVMAHITQFSPGNLYGKAGVMMRQSTDQASPFYWVGLNYTSGNPSSIEVVYRRYQGAAAVTVVTTGSVSAPVYVRIVRTGTSFTAYTATNPFAYSPVNGSTVSLPMTDPTLAGLVVASGWSGQSSTAVADTVGVQPMGGAAITNCLQGWQCVDIGNTSGIPGLSATDGGNSWALSGYGRYFGQTNGGDNSDGLRYAYQTGQNAGSVTAHVTFEAYSSCEATAGLMVRGSTATTEVFFDAAVVYGGCGGSDGYPYIEVQDRTTTQAPNNQITCLNCNFNHGFDIPSGAHQAYLRIDWNGGSFKASYSFSGQSWTVLAQGADTIAGFPSSPLVGIYDQDGQGSGLGTAGFDAVSVGGPDTSALHGKHSPSIKDTSCHCGEPVNTDTGEYWSTDTDLSIPGRGVPLDFSRTYNSLLASQSGPLGYGWSEGYGMSLSTDGNGNDTVNEENGSSVTFACSTTCTAPAWVLATLVSNGDGTYTFTRDQSQERFVFAAPVVGSPGVLQKEIDRNGYVTALSYSNGQLTTVTDPAGRTLTFDWDGAGHISRITDPIGRTVTFAYDDNGNLAAVTDVGNATTDFSYDPTHLLLTATDPRGGVLTNVYDGSGRVTSQTDAMHRTMTFAYATNSDGSQTTTVTLPSGHVNTFTFISNELVSQTLGANTPQAATSGYLYSPTLGVTATIDPNGNTWTATYDGNGNLLSNTDPLGRTTWYSYDSLNDLTSVTKPNGATIAYTYDGSGNLQTITEPLDITGHTATTTLTYGDTSHPGDVTKVTDPNGNVTAFAYTANGDLASQTTPGSRETTYSYDTIGRLTAMVSPNGRVAGATAANFTTTYSYDAYGDLTDVTDPLGNVTSYLYDPDQNPIVQTDPRGNTTYWTYDPDNEVCAITDPLAGATSPPTTCPTAATAHTTIYQYDGDGNVTTEIDPLGHTTTSAYDALDRLTTVTDALNHTVTYAYDGNSNVLSVTDQNTHTTSYSHDAANEPISTTLPDGAVTTTSYDADGNVASQVSPDGNANGANPAQYTTTNTYDLADRLVSETDPLGHTTSYQYDADDNLIGETDPQGNTTYATYDGNNEVCAVTDALSGDTSPPTVCPTTSVAHTVVASYDADGNLTAQIDQLGHTTTYAYDALDRERSRTNPDNRTTTYAYDADGNPATVTDPLGQTTAYQYDALDRLTGTSYLTGDTVSIAAGWNLLSVPVSGGDATTAAGLVASINSALSAGATTQAVATYANGRFSLYVPGYSPNLTLPPSQGVFVLSGASGTWTPSGSQYTTGQPVSLQAGWNLVAAPFPASGLDEAAISSSLSSTCNPQEIATDANGSYQTYIPGGSGSLTIPPTAGMWIECTAAASWTPSGTSTPPTAHAVTYAYDADGGRTSMTDGTGTTSYGYDSLERLTSVTNGATQQVGYGYDNAGNLTSLTYPGTLQVTRGYDANNRLTSVTDWLNHTTSFGYDLNDNLTSEAYPNGTSAALTYNAADQLTQIVDSTGSTPFWTFGETRNNLGQLATHADPIDTLSHTYSYNKLNQLTSDATSHDTAGWSYDAAGQLTGTTDSTAGTSSTLSYSPSGQLNSLVTTAGGSTTQNLGYSYDTDGNRTGSSDSVSGKSATYGYDAADRLTTYTSGSTSASYSYDGDGLRQSKTVNGTTTPYTWDVSGDLPTILQAGTTKYITGPDGLPVEQVDGSGNVLYYLQDQLGSTRGLLDSSGNIAASFTYNPYGQLTGSTGTATTPFGFGGQCTDAESGLQYLRNRCYDPATEQFLTRDPLVDATDTPYGYVYGDPLNGLDPLGLGCGILSPQDCPGALASEAWHLIGQLGNRVNGPPCTLGRKRCFTLATHEIAHGLVFGLRGQSSVACNVSIGVFITMDDAIDMGTAHVGPGARMETTGSGKNYQFRSTSTDSAGRLVQHIARFDVNPADSHVQRYGGPHLNLEVHVNGRPVSNRHVNINPSTVRPGDHP